MTRKQLEALAEWVDIRIDQRTYPSSDGDPFWQDEADAWFKVLAAFTEEKTS